MIPTRPPFTAESARAKVQAAEDPWDSSRSGTRVAAYASINDTRIRTNERRLFSPQRPSATAEVPR